MPELFMILGFMLAAYAVVGNDSIQTLGTFLYSNSHRRWWVLWLYSSTIMVSVILFGWFTYERDPSYNRLDRVYGKSLSLEVVEAGIATARAAVAADPTQARILAELDDLETQLLAVELAFGERPQDLDGELERLAMVMAPLRGETVDPAVPNPQQVAVKTVVREVDDLLATIDQRRDVSRFINWKFLLPPLALLLLTRFGFPVSTSFLVLITFQPAVLGDMMIKSLSGYLLAFIVAILVYLVVARHFEKRWRESGESGISPRWVVLQWCSTAFLWAMWLVQDMANIFIYLPRQLGPAWIVFAILWMVAMQGIIYYTHGGKIQKVVTSKTNTHDIRSATVVDLIYGVVLFFFKNYSTVPMSTTWVFLGLLAGRELAFALMHSGPSVSRALKLARKDMVKAGFGLGVSVAIAQLIAFLP
jgi:hypothetical protein